MNRKERGDGAQKKEKKEKKVGPRKKRERSIEKALYGIAIDPPATPSAPSRGFRASQRHLAGGSNLQWSHTDFKPHSFQRVNGLSIYIYNYISAFPAWTGTDALIGKESD